MSAKIERLFSYKNKYWPSENRNYYLKIKRQVRHHKLCPLFKSNPYIKTKLLIYKLIVRPIWSYRI